MKSTREIWINKLEEMCILLAANGQEYAHVYSVMQSETDKLLENVTKTELPAPDNLYEPKMVYREITCSVQGLFCELNIGDTLRVFSQGDVTPDKLRSRIGVAVIRYNEANNVNHIYESHKDELGIKFKRVG